MRYTMLSGILLTSFCCSVVPILAAQEIDKALLRRATSGDIPAMLKVARAFESGKGGTANPVEAAR